MIDHTVRITDVLRGELHKLTLDQEAIGFGAGYSYGIIPIDDQGHIYQGPLWIVMLSMRNPLLGREDIVRSLPVFGILPGDDVFRQIAGRLLDECRKDRDESMKVPDAKV